MIRLLWLIVAVAIAYLSLYPLTGWRLRQPSIWSFLGHGVPRYYSYADIVANIAAYVVYGLLFALGWFTRRRPWVCALLAAGSGMLLSLMLESLQSYLPTRVPSLLDFYANGIGAALGGAVGASIGVWRADPTGGAGRVSLPWYEQGPAIGWALLVVWLIAQLPPQRLLFSTGHWQSWLLQLAPAGAADHWSLLLPGPLPDAFRSLVETMVVAIMISIVGILMMDLVRPTGARIGWIVALLAIGLVFRMAASAQVYSTAPLFAWLTSGAQAGLVLGALALYLIGAFRRRTRLAIGAALVPIGLLLVNLAPRDPYFLSALAGSGPLTPALTPSLRSLINALGMLWPLFALAYLLIRYWTLRRGK
ncbi:MAG: VanZ family protein [Lautropia sp.]